MIAEAILKSNDGSGVEGADPALDGGSPDGVSGQPVTVPTVQVEGANYGAIMIGDNNTLIYGRESEVRVRVLGDPPVPEGVGPAGYLDPDYELVPFVDSDDSRRLSAWREAGTDRSVALLAGPAGVGKTRLALHTAREAAAAGWRVFVASSSLSVRRPDERPLIHEASEDVPTMLIVDYADRWPASDLRVLVSEAARLSPTVRVLLASRSELFWRPTAHMFRSAGFDPDTVLSVGSAVSNSDEATQMFLTARAHYARQMRREVPRDAPHGVADLRHVLSLHAAALLNVLEDSSGKDPPQADLSWNRLSTVLIDRELAHWLVMIEGAAPPLGTSAEDLFRVTVLASLLGGVNIETAHEALGRCGLQHPDRIIRDHARLYPPVDGATTLAPLLPDRVAEDLIARSIASAPPTALLRGWGGPTLDRLIHALMTWEQTFELPEGTFPFPDVRVARALNVLAGAGERWPHIRDLLAAELERRPELVVIPGQSLAATLAEHLPVRLLRRLSETFEDFAPLGTNLLLQEGELKVLETLSRSPEFDAFSTEDQVRHLARLGHVLGQSGNQREAVSFTTRAAELLLETGGVRLEGGEVLVSDEVDSGLVGYALGVHVHQCSAVGARDEALFYSALAARIVQRRLEEGDEPPGAWAVGIIDGHATALVEAGKLGEGIGLHRWLLGNQLQTPYEEMSEQERAALSVTMNNLGLRLREHGDRVEGRRLLEQALRVRFELAEHLPPVFLPLLAESSASLAQACLDDDDVEKALFLADNAVGIRRDLSQAIPGSYLDPLRKSLRLLGVVHTKMGQASDAGAVWMDYFDLLHSQAKTVHHDGVGLCEEFADVLAYVARSGRTTEAAEGARLFLPSETPTAAGLEAALCSVALLALAQMYRDEDDVGSAASLIAEHGATLSLCPTSLVDATKVTNLAFWLLNKAQPFEILAPVIALSVRTLVAAEEPLAADKSLVIVRALDVWLDSMPTDRTDLASVLVDVVTTALPILRSALGTDNDALIRLCSLCNNTVAIGSSIGTKGLLPVARIGKEASDVLYERGSQESSHRVAMLNAFALTACLDGASASEALPAAEAALEAARRRFEDARTLGALTDLATSFETLSLAYVRDGQANKAFDAVLEALRIRISAVTHGGERYLVALQIGWQIVVGRVTDAGREGDLPQIWRETVAAVPPEIAAQLNGHPDGLPRSFGT